MFSTECTECSVGEGPSFSVPDIRSLYTQGPSARRGSSCIVLLPSSGSGFSWFVFVGEGFKRLSTLFWGSREGNSQIFEVFWKFFKDFLTPAKRSD